jgi:hypothetical protein
MLRSIAESSSFFFLIFFTGEVDGESVVLLGVDTGVECDLFEDPD